MVALRRGALLAAEAEFRAGLDVLPHAWRRRASLIAGLLDVLVETGDLPTAQALLESDGRDEALPDDRASNFLLASHSRLRFARGDPHRALADALEGRRRRVRDGSAGIRQLGRLVAHRPASPHTRPARRGTPRSRRLSHRRSSLGHSWRHRPSAAHERTHRAR
jgi:hypothetical protein